MKPERTVCGKLGPDPLRDFNSQIAEWNEIALTFKSQP